jgi:hypothetical protein
MLTTAAARTGLITCTASGWLPRSRWLARRRIRVQCLERAAPGQCSAGDEATYPNDDIKAPLGPDGTQLLTAVTRTLLPTMQKAGIAANVDVETLEQRLRAEVMGANATIVSPAIVGAWTNVDARE